ncbi:MAG: pyrimidine 5'-nucleotidase [Alphaproteobacteria bacterium]|nr:pyrimidine 5'-nucleotidase [Alphaproteobacteria bacterium]
MTERAPTHPSAAPTLDPIAVETWVFDLDNTLYPARSNLFVQVSARMTEFIMDRFALDHEPARELQRDMFRRHGTTLRGLMSEHSVDPGPFLDYVHDIDVSPIDPSPELSALLGRLPGRKIVFTNGSVPHAERVMRRLGVDRHFDLVFDIVASDYVPKPDPQPYDRLIEVSGLDPRRAVMIEDMAKNLAPAAERGMTTVWLRSEHEWATAGAEGDHVHHVAEDLIQFLAGALGSVPTPR